MIAFRAVFLAIFSLLREDVSQEYPNFRVNQAGIVEIISLMHTGLSDDTKNI